MAILKKIRGATLMETLIATVLIVVIFTLASLILNNTFSNHIKDHRHDLYNEIYELEYLWFTDVVEAPYTSNYKNWTIQLNTTIENGRERFVIHAVQNKSQKEIKRVTYAY